MANVILVSPFIENSENFNRLVNLALNSTECCCENIYLKKLYSIFSLEYELERYYKYSGGDNIFAIGSPARIRMTAINSKIAEILNSICDEVELLQNVTDNQVSYSDMLDTLWKLSKDEYKLGKEKCWCNLLKTSLAFQIDQTPELYDLLNSDNLILVDKIIAQSTIHFTPTVNTITVNSQVLTP